MRPTLCLLTLSIALPALAQDDAPDPSDAWREHLATQRVAALDHLEAYASARVFPVNDTELGPVHQLRDASGHPCAMAYLVEQSGHTALIDSLSVTANDTQFATQTDGALFDWTLTSGLTLEEAAMVQVPGFFEGLDLGSMQIIVQQVEGERLYAHFSTTTAALRARTDMSLDVAVERLGDRVHTAPPTTGLVVASR